MCLTADGYTVHRLELVQKENSQNVNSKDVTLLASFTLQIDSYCFFFFKSRDQQL